MCNSKPVQNDSGIMPMNRNVQSNRACDDPPAGGLHFFNRYQSVIQTPDPSANQSFSH